jgi:cellulose synthase/poly-beta-1,6-N-acetylglucosamine synthase-like glycosyltransferase
MQLIKQRIRWRRGALKTYYYCWDYYKGQIKGLRAVGLLGVYEIAIIAGMPLLWFNFFNNPLAVILLGIACGAVIQSILMSANPEFQPEKKLPAALYVFPQIAVLFFVDVIANPIALCQAGRVIVAKMAESDECSWMKGSALAQKLLPVAAIFIIAGNIYLLLQFGMLVTHAYTILVGIYIVTRVVPGILLYRTPKDAGYTDLPTITMVIPSYNEEGSVAQTIDRALETGYPMEKIEVVAINDGSIDGTWEAMKEAASKYTNVRLINFEQNRGKREGLYEGIMAATGDVIPDSSAVCRSVRPRGFGSHRCA